MTVKPRLRVSKQTFEVFTGQMPATCTKIAEALKLNPSTVRRIIILGKNDGHFVPVDTYQPPRGGNPRVVWGTPEMVKKPEPEVHAPWHNAWLQQTKGKQP